MTLLKTAISEVAICPPTAQRLPVALEISAYFLGSSTGRLQRVPSKRKAVARAVAMRSELLRPHVALGQERLFDDLQGHRLALDCAVEGDLPQLSVRRTSVRLGEDNGR